MSGLALFFREHIHGQGSNANVPYATSLLDVLAPKTTPDKGPDPSITQGPTSIVPVTVQAWRNAQKTVLSEFFTRRIIGDDIDEESNDENTSNLNLRSEPSHSPRRTRTNDRHPEDTALETQQDQMDDTRGDSDKEVSQTPRHGDNDHAASTATGQVERTVARGIFCMPRHVPHERETSGVASTIAELDLYVNAVSLHLCRANLYWPRRRTRRIMDFPSHYLPHYQDDGPVSVLYNPIKRLGSGGGSTAPLPSVISVEIHQCHLDVEPVSELRRRAQQLHWSLQHVKAHLSTTTMYLYGAYAERFHDLLEEVQNVQRKHSTATVQLYLLPVHIPFWCVLPQPARDWYEADTTPFCLCIGDETSMQIDDEARFRLDHPPLLMQCLVVNDNDSTTLAHFTLHYHPTKGAVLERVPVVTANDKEGTIQAQYHQYVRATRGKDSDDTGNDSDDWLGDEEMSGIDNAPRDSEFVGVSAEALSTRASGTEPTPPPNDSSMESGKRPATSTVERAPSRRTEQSPNVATPTSRHHVVGKSPGSSKRQRVDDAKYEKLVCSSQCCFARFSCVCTSHISIVPSILSPLCQACWRQMPCLARPEIAEVARFLCMPLLLALLNPTAQNEAIG
jgi:hypothetical protein